jgi:hypothetical protein
MKPAVKTQRDDLMNTGVITAGGMPTNGPSVRMVPDQVPLS